MTFKEAKNYNGPVRRAKVISNVLSPSKHDVGQVISIIGACESNPFLLWTRSTAVVDYRDIEFESEGK